MPKPFGRQLHLTLSKLKAAEIKSLTRACLLLLQTLTPPVHLVSSCLNEPEIASVDYSIGPSALHQEAYPYLAKLSSRSLTLYTSIQVPIQRHVVRSSHHLHSLPPSIHHAAPHPHPPFRPRGSHLRSKPRRPAHVCSKLRRQFPRQHRLQWHRHRLHMQQ